MNEWTQRLAEGPLTVLYTCAAPESVLGPFEQPAATMTLAVGHRWLEIEPDGRGGGVVRRLISSDPQDYLHPAYQPGAWVPLHRTASQS